MADRGKRDYRATVGYIYDPAGERAFTDANNRVSQSVRGVVDDFEQLSGVTRTNVTLLRDRMATATRMAGELAAEEAAVRKETAAIEAQTAALERQGGAIRRRLEAGVQVRNTQESPDSFAGGLRTDMLSGATGGSSGRTAGETITKLGYNIFNAPAVGPSTPIARAMIGVGPVIDKLGLSLAQVGVLGGVAAAAFVAIAVAADQFNKTIEVGKRRLDAAIAAQNAYYQAVATLTSQEARERLESLRLQQEAQRQQLEESRAAQEGAFAGVQQIVGGQVTFIGDAIARLFDNQTPVAQLRDAAEKAEVQLNTTNDEITRLEQGLQEGAFAANDAREAEERLAREREEAADRILQMELGLARDTTRALGMTAEQRREEANSIRSQIAGLEQYIENNHLSQDALKALNTEITDLQNRLAAITSVTATYADAVAAAQALVQSAVVQQAEYNRLARTGTSEAVREQIATNEDLIALYEQANDRLAQLSVDALLSGNTDAHNAYQSTLADNLEQVANLTDANKELTNSVLPVIEAREREQKLTEGLTDAYDQYLKALEAEGKAREAINEAQQAINDEMQKFADKQDEIATTLAEAEQKAAEKQQEALAELESESGERREKIAEDTAKRIQKIERDFSRDYTTAVGNRDAAAADQAKRRREEQLQDVKDEQTEQEQSLQKTLEKQRKIIEKQYRDQLKSALDAANKATRIENQRHDRELAIRQRAYDAAQVQLTNAMNAQTATYQTVRQLADATGATVRAQWVNIQQAFSTGMSFLLQTVTNGFLSAGRPPQAAMQYSTPIGPSPATGSFAPPSPFTSPFLLPPIGRNSGMVLNINMNGVTTRTMNTISQRNAEQVVMESFRQMTATRN